MWKYIPNTELYHHGVKGQKWGVRKKVQTGTRKSSGTFQPNNTSNNSSGSDDVAQRRAKQGKKQYRKDMQEYRKQQRVRKALVITAGVAITAATAYATYKHFNKSPELNAMLSQKTKVSDIPKLKLLEESTSDGVDQVRYEIETFSLLGFQKYIQRFDGDFVFLKIEAMDN